MALSCSRVETRFLSSEVTTFIKAQVDAIDDILLNAYGTVYKFDIKQIISASGEYVLSQTEDVLSAKNLFSNLWSVLDFCCAVIYSHHNNSLPTLDQGFKIKFPCKFPKNNNSMSFEDWKTWERKKLMEVLDDEDVTDEHLQHFDGVFQHVQFKNKRADEITGSKVYYFYLLQYLRNTLTHSSIDIDFRRTSTGVLPDLLRAKYESEHLF